MITPSKNGVITTFYQLPDAEMYFGSFAHQPKRQYHLSIQFTGWKSSKNYLILCYEIIIDNRIYF